MIRLLLIASLLFPTPAWCFMGLTNGDRIPTSDKFVQHTVVTVGLIAVELKVGATRNEQRKFIVIYNDSSVTVYLGESNVTTSGATKGIPLLKYQSATLAVGDTPIYAIAGSAGNNIILMESG